MKITVLRKIIIGVNLLVIFGWANADDIKIINNTSYSFYYGIQIQCIDSSNGHLSITTTPELLNNGYSVTVEGSSFGCKTGDHMGLYSGYDYFWDNYFSLCPVYNGTTYPEYDSTKNYTFIISDTGEYTPGQCEGTIS